jgi:hypothetical protein
METMKSINSFELISQASKYRYELTFGYYTNKTDKVKYNNLGLSPYFNFKDDDEAIDIAEKILVNDYAIKDKTHKNLFVIITNIKTNQVIKIKRLTR